MTDAEYKQILEYLGVPENYKKKFMRENRRIINYIIMKYGFPLSERTNKIKVLNNTPLCYGPNDFEFILTKDWHMFAGTQDAIKIDEIGCFTIYTFK